MKLRNEILIRKTEDGCVELYDPLMQQSLLLSHEDSASFEKDSAHWKQELIQKLEDANIFISTMGASLRIVTHLDYSTSSHQAFISVLKAM